MSAIQYRPADYRAYLQMSHRNHVLVEDEQKKASLESRIEELATQSHYEVDIDIDDASFLIDSAELLSGKITVGDIYASVAGTPYAYKLIAPEELEFNEPESFEVVSVDEEYSQESSELSIEEAVDNLPSEQVIIPNRTEVCDYLQSHYVLLDDLQFIVEKCIEQFDQQTQLSIEVYHDPEIEDSNLTIYIRQQHYDENIMSSIQEVREKYRDTFHDKSDWIHVTTDFDYPR
jgi:hypothetical protein